MKLFNAILYSILFLSFSFSSYSQKRDSLLTNTEISILTCRSGDELYSTFGHTAIRIFNKSKNEDLVYNYGLFSFDTPNFYLKFMRGQLPYYLGGMTMNRFLREYDFEKRSVFEQKLNLTNAQKRKIIEFIVENAKPENRSYKYDFFYDNCATRVVDVWELAGDVSYSLIVEEKTFRDLLKENLKNLVWSDFGIDIVIGARADRITDRRDQMFLPEYVMENLASAKLNSTLPLAESPYVVLDYEELNSKRKSKSINWPLYCTLLILLVTLVVNLTSQKWATTYNNYLLILSGVMGMFLLFMWFGTDHAATRYNWNLLWLNPLLIIYLIAKGSIKKILLYLLLLLNIISALNCIFTFLPQFFNFAFLPLVLSFIVVLIRAFRVQAGILKQQSV